MDKQKNDNNKIDLNKVLLLIALISSILYVFNQYFKMYGYVCPYQTKNSQIPLLETDIKDFKSKIIPYKKKKFTYYKGVIVKIDDIIENKRKRIYKLKKEIIKLIEQGKDIRNKLDELKYEQKEYLKSLDSIAVITKKNNNFINSSSKHIIDSLKKKLLTDKQKVKIYTNKIIDLKINCNE